MSISYSQWEIWQVNWVYHDARILPRPALLISPSSYNASQSSLVFAKISTKMHDVPHRLDLAEGEEGFAQTGLNESCFVYLGNVQEINKPDILRKRGILSNDHAQTAWNIIQKALRG